MYALHSNLPGSLMLYHTSFSVAADMFAAHLVLLAHSLLNDIIHSCKKAAVLFHAYRLGAEDMILQ